MSPNEEDVCRSVTVEDTSPKSTRASTKKGTQFWLVFAAISLTSFVAALDATIISNALPTIAADLGSEELYVWVIDAYLLASTATGPIYAQTANIFGRRSLTVLSVCFFALGSGISGGATKSAMLVGGRAVQGLGGGGILTMSEIVICDLVSIRERGLYAGILGGVWAVASVAGPIMGGALAQHVSWRWIFYLNLPICGAALLLLVLFLRVKHPKQGTIRDQLSRIDWGGSTILILAVTSTILALSWGGTEQPWSSWRVILPLVLGIIGLLGFIVYQASPWLEEPTMPLRLFANRTSSSIFLLSFVQSMVLFGLCYFLPVYFQAVLGASPTRSAIMLFPLATTACPAGILAGLLITKTGKFRIWHFLGFGFMSLACGLFILFDADSSSGQWIGFQILFGIGCGFLFTSCLPPVLASLPDSDVATATGAWTFIRNFGAIWGTAVPAAIFDTQANQMASKITDLEVRALLVSGGAYEHGTRDFMDSFNDHPALKRAIINLYVDSLKVVWEVSLAFALLGFAIAFLVKGVTLRDELNTDFGLEQRSSVPEKEYCTQHVRVD